LKNNGDAGGEDVMFNLQQELKTSKEEIVYLETKLRDT
jgi:hypothetical protein